MSPHLLPSVASHLPGHHIARVTIVAAENHLLLENHLM